MALQIMLALTMDTMVMRRMRLNRNTANRKLLRQLHHRHHHSTEVSLN